MDKWVNAGLGVTDISIFFFKRNQKFHVNYNIIVTAFGLTLKFIFDRI